MQPMRHIGAAGAGQERQQDQGTGRAGLHGFSPALLSRFPVWRRGVLVGLWLWVWVCPGLAGWNLRADGLPAAPAVPEVAPVSEELRMRLKLGPFYQKHVEVGGLPVLGSARVSDAALREAAWILGHMMAGRPEWLARMGERGARVVVMAHDEYTTDVPEHARLRPKIYWDRRARGLGGRITSCGEENLLGFPGDPYAGENILIHEFAHALHHVALRGLEPGFQEALEELHRRALAEGRWSGTYAASNPEEYWAEGVQSWFDCNRENDASHNHVNTREELELYDPGLARLCARVFGPNPWRYRRPGERPPEARVHLGDFDPGRAPRFRWPDPPLGERVVVRFDLAAGSLEAELYPRQAPRTVRHFLNLVRDGFYRGGILIWVPAGGSQSRAGFWEGRTDPGRATELPPLLTWEGPGQVGPEHARGTIWWVFEGPAEPAERFRIDGGAQVLQSVPGAEPAGSGTRLTALGRVIRGLDLLERLRDDAASGLPARAGLRLQGVYRLE
ncbi:hypothetical protein G4L39_13120 [Limisphaera ngatamarikiensis]|uniref:PPIase cyclophilin-type domain-containing protein n=1 Tax=Limisphaera ngatamarikiensis TaxID=1324935 RepID=A0A6M1S4Y4_9BACT|nr:peptidylprolyl isomerase [Limisphaera ngatamarikiensis]NGO40330.1 hypothetical protein [Limisphaera ngatamarikiensis]